MRIFDAFLGRGSNGLLADLPFFSSTSDFLTASLASSLCSCSSYNVLEICILFLLVCLEVSKDIRVCLGMLRVDLVYSQSHFLSDFIENQRYVGLTKNQF